MLKAFWVRIESGNLADFRYYRWNVRCGSWLAFPSEAVYATVVEPDDSDDVCGTSRNGISQMR